jgi:hypothetical protein
MFRSVKYPGRSDHHKQWQGCLKKIIMKLYNFFKIIPLFIIICVLAISCGGNEGGNMGNKISRGIEFLGRSDCIHSPTMEKNFVSALDNSEDLFGMPKPKPIASAPT